MNNPSSRLFLSAFVFWLSVCLLFFVCSLCVWHCVFVCMSRKQVTQSFTDKRGLQICDKYSSVCMILSTPFFSWILSFTLSTNGCAFVKHESLVWLVFMLYVARCSSPLLLPLPLGWLKINRQHCRAKGQSVPQQRRRSSTRCFLTNSFIPFYHFQSHTHSYLAKSCVFVLVVCFHRQSIEWKKQSQRKRKIYKMNDKISHRTDLSYRENNRSIGRSAVRKCWIWKA